MLAFMYAHVIACEDVAGVQEELPYTVPDKLVPKFLEADCPVAAAPSVIPLL